MARRTFMVYVTSGEISDARVRMACDLAARFDARLIGISARTYPADTFAHGAISNETLNYETQKIAAEFKDREANFRRLACEKTARMEWRCAQEFPIQGVVREMRAADLLIIGTDREVARPQQPLDVVSALLRTGRPVLLVPDRVRELPLANVFVAWKDTREARRVVLDALPVLRSAVSVTLAGIGEDNRSQTEIGSQIADVATYLSGHGVTTEQLIVERPKKAAGEEIIGLAREKGADLIVAGAYGRSQVGEWIFGGVTETLIHKSPIACFLSH